MFEWQADRVISDKKILQFFARRFMSVLEWHVAVFAVSFVSSALLQIHSLSTGTVLVNFFPVISEQSLNSDSLAKILFLWTPLPLCKTAVFLSSSHWLQWHGSVNLPVATLNHSPTLQGNIFRSMVFSGFRLHSYLGTCGLRWVTKLKAIIWRYSYWSHSYRSTVQRGTSYSEQQTERMEKKQWSAWYTVIRRG
jgi:hypothetical protein